MGLEELHGGRNPAERLITRDLAFRPTDRIEEIAAEVRTYLGVTMEQQFSWGNAETALEEWRKVLLGVGVYVFKDQFREPDYSGFCLYDDEFPIIYVNNTTAKTRQIFTLFHELAHLLFHTSGVDKPPPPPAPARPPRTPACTGRISASGPIAFSGLSLSFTVGRPFAATALHTSENGASASPSTSPRKSFVSSVPQPKLTRTRPENCRVQ
jgi:hypothetical protein